MTTTCYHGRRHIAGDTRSPVEVTAHDRIAAHRAPLVHFVKHSPGGFGWGYYGSAPVELARCLLIDALGPVAMCPMCAGRQWVIWAGPDTDDDPRPYDPDRDDHDDLVTRCYCDDGIRALPYHPLAAQIIRNLPDHWRITRAELLTWLVGHFPEQVPDWLAPVVPITDVELPL